MNIDQIKPGMKIRKLTLLPHPNSIEEIVSLHAAPGLISYVMVKYSIWSVPVMELPKFLEVVETEELKEPKQLTLF
ncbi:MAG: hypothetical protein HC908_01665 [Calothrix sp. SM1_7_51]|nr:hypothetical protein [Calothrix sp. SM1_7_51]